MVSRRRKKAKSIDVLKEDQHTFELLVEKVRTREEALPYPVTSIPPALEFPDNTLRQSLKASLRNFSKGDARSLCKQPNEVSDWFIDSMATVNSIGSKDK